MNIKHALSISFTLLYGLFVCSQNLIAQTINVDDTPYNAVGDGVTDDHDAIQSAIWTLRSTGGTLEFTSGKTYILSEGLTFNTFPDTHDYLVTSSGTATATIKMTDGAPLTWNHWNIRLSESKNITLKNLILDGNRDTRNPLIETSGTDVLFIDGDSNGTRLLDLEMINSPMDNIYITVHDNQGQTRMTDFEMHNCKLINGFRNNMSIISGQNFKIISCEFINANGTDPQSGLDFEPNNNTPEGYSNMTVEGCLFKDNVRYGIELTYIKPGDGSSIIKNNTFENNGILIASKDNQIHHNIYAKQDHQHLHGNMTRDGIIYFHTGVSATGNNVHHNYFYDNNMPAGSHLVNFMYNSGGGNMLHDNYGYGNMVADFVINNTNLATTPQIINDNTFLNHREMGYWNMDNIEISGTTINDLSDFDHDGTIVGATSVPGVENEALNFAPDDKYIAISADENLNIEMNFTVMAWIKWGGTNAETQQVIMGRGDDWRFGVTNNGHLGLYADAPYTAGWTRSGANAIMPNQWQLATATYDGRHTRIYIDGVEQANEQANGAFESLISNIYIGGFSTTLYSFNGIIDDARIYNYALDQTEIEAIFNSSPLAVEWIAPLIARRQSNDIALSWTVSNQIGNSMFKIEYAKDGIHFVSIGAIEGGNNWITEKELKFTHSSPIGSEHYYRIKQIDNSGTFSYSNIAYVKMPNSTINLYPNPTYNEVTIESDNSIISIEIYNINGKLVKSSVANTRINTSGLSKGIYLVKINTASNIKFKKMIKE